MRRLLLLFASLILLSACGNREGGWTKNKVTEGVSTSSSGLHFEYRLDYIEVWFRGVTPDSAKINWHKIGEGSVVYANVAGSFTPVTGYSVESGAVSVWGLNSYGRVLSIQITKGDDHD